MKASYHLESIHNNDLRGNITKSDIFLLCFAVNDEQSFHRVFNRYVKMITISIGANTPFIVVGCKCDLPREISREQALEWTEQAGAVCYLETSARDEYGTRELFQVIISAIHKTKPQPLVVEQKKCSIQ